jgi:hypothetical protein
MNAQATTANVSTLTAAIMIPRKVLTAAFSPRDRSWEASATAATFDGVHGDYSASCPAHGAGTATIEADTARNSVRRPVVA